jgi:molecular chaperone GrpE
MPDPNRPDPDPAPPADAESPDDVVDAEGGEAASDAGPIPAAPADGAAADVAALRASVAGLEERLRRQQADFVNDMRRVRREADERVRFAAQPVVTDLLGVADALHGAIEQLGQSEHETRVAEGLRLVERELVDALGRHGVAKIDALNKPFDPAFHQAILEVESPAAARTVIQVVRPGFTLNGRVVRPAHVIVSKPPAAG